MGTTNVTAKTNFERKVEIVDCQISFVVCLSSDSSDIWIPNASENASAIAIVNIPPMITSFEWVPECKPTIRPSVVIIPDVMPKLNPVFNECLIYSIIIEKGILSSVFNHRVSFTTEALRTQRKNIR